MLACTYIAHLCVNSTIENNYWAGGSLSSVVLREFVDIFTLHTSAVYEDEWEHYMWQVVQRMWSELYKQLVIDVCFLHLKYLVLRTGCYDSDQLFMLGSCFGGCIEIQETCDKDTFRENWFLSTMLFFHSKCLCNAFLSYIYCTQQIKERYNGYIYQSII